MVKYNINKIYVIGEPKYFAKDRNEPSSISPPPRGGDIFDFCHPLRFQCHPHFVGVNLEFPDVGIKGRILLRKSVCAKLRHLGKLHWMNNYNLVIGHS